VKRDENAVFAHVLKPLELKCNSLLHVLSRPSAVS
jgi:hypothetical protein